MVSGYQWYPGYFNSILRESTSSLPPAPPLAVLPRIPRIPNKPTRVPPGYTKTQEKQLEPLFVYTSSGINQRGSLKKQSSHIHFLLGPAVYATAMDAKAIDANDIEATAIDTNKHPSKLHGSLRDSVHCPNLFIHLGIHHISIASGVFLYISRETLILYTPPIYSSGIRVSAYQWYPGYFYNILRESTSSLHPAHQMGWLHQIPGIPKCVPGYAHG